MASAKDRADTARMSLAEVTARYREHNDAIARRLPALDGLLERCKATLVRLQAHNDARGKGGNQGE